MPDDLGKQQGQAVPGNLHADAKQEKSDDAQHAVRSSRRGRNRLRDLWRVSVAEVNKEQPSAITARNTPRCARIFFEMTSSEI